jgi:hypothetical protein
MWLSGFSSYPVPCANAETNAPAAGSGAATTRPAGKPGSYMVRTVWNDAPLTKTRVEWHLHMDDTSPALAGNTIGVGTANFRPTPGSYYLTAEWRPDGDFTRPRKPGDRTAWFGGNPLLVSSETSEVVTLILEEVPVPPAPLPTGTGIFGRVTHGGVPVANAGIYAYAKTESGFKGDDFQAHVHTNAKGEFALALPPDRYYILARLRADNSVDIGPLHKDDLLGYDPGNPVVVVEGSYSKSAVPMTRLKMVKSRAESSAFQPGTIEGRIVDRSGRPVSGVYAALYQKQTMTGRSVFRSDPAGPDGRFKLSVPIPGKYFLGARNGYGAPVSGGWFGGWSGSEDHSISIKTGEVRPNLEIIVDRLTLGVVPAEIHDEHKHHDNLK